MKKLKDVDMSKYTSFRTGGKAREMIIPESFEELAQVLKNINAERTEFIMLGNGTNTLVTDNGFDGLVVKLGEAFGKVEIQGETMICGSAALMSSVAKEALRASLSGFEFASGIPGSLGGAVYMNAGAYGGEMRDIVSTVKIMDRKTCEIRDVAVEEMEFGYRHSMLEEKGDIVLEVELRLEKGDDTEIGENMKELTKRRNDKQPVQYPSAGSFFKRPKGYFAGKLVEDAGLKGLTVGGAQVSEKHSGFIINKGGATSSDIISLMHLVQNTVMDKFGVKLEPEVRIIGD